MAAKVLLATTVFGKSAFKGLDQTQSSPAFHIKRANTYDVK